jgi:hypothetical protein
LGAREVKLSTGGQPAAIDASNFPDSPGPLTGKAVRRREDPEVSVRDSRQDTDGRKGDEGTG